MRTDRNIHSAIYTHTEHTYSITDVSPLANDSVEIFRNATENTPCYQDAAVA